MIYLYELKLTHDQTKPQSITHEVHAETRQCADSLIMDVMELLEYGFARLISVYGQIDRPSQLSK